MKLYFIILLFCFCYKLLKADIGFLNNTTGDSLPYFKNCTEKLEVFAESASNFTLCSIKHARPIRMCEKCVTQYTVFMKTYKDLLDTVVNGSTCKSVFISNDRLDIVLEYHDSILHVWNKGNCNACYTWSECTPILSNSTKRFNMMHNETINCIINNMNSYGNNSAEVCEKCMQSYVQLDEFYKTLSVDSIGVDTVCMDIVDSMNKTRSIWSKNLNCCNLRKTPEIIFLCCTGIISFLPILFYLVVRYCGPIRDFPNVLKQTRFKQRLLTSINYRRIN